jgi:hypothetical protein
MYESFGIEISTSIPDVSSLMQVERGTASKRRFSRMSLQNRIPKLAYYWDVAS